MMLKLTSISAQENYHVKKPVRIDSFYCFDRNDVLNIIHSQIKNDDCDSMELSYEKTEHLYKETISARDSQLVTKNRIITAKDFIISKKDEQISIREDQNKILKKKVWTTKLKAWTIPTGVAAVLVIIGTVIAKFSLHLY